MHSVCALIPLIMALAVTGCDENKGAKESAMSRISAVGGLDRVNSEAKEIFVLFHTNQVKVFYDNDLTNFPSLASLGNSLSFHGELPDFPAYVRIRYGTHWNSRNLLIYQTAQTNPSLGGSIRLIPLSTNIFVAIQK